MIQASRKTDQKVGLEWVILLASAMHCVWGILIFLSPDPYRSTPIAGIHSILGDIGGRPLAGSTLILVAVLAIWSMFLKKTPWTLAMLLPQESFLVMSSTSAGLAMIQAHYADLVVRSSYFIIADQVIYLLLALMYPCAIWKSYIWDAFVVKREVRGGE